ncbi:hypothetical protein V1477_012244 [Vespula maculifrons]|uniref:Uncharacterized protein n=1 Tax=Vespula maculifrons TaxID=7453 RepID=A0ABD2BWY4_VESMC
MEEVEEEEEEEEEEEGRRQVDTLLFKLRYSLHSGLRESFHCFLFAKVRNRVVLVMWRGESGGGGGRGEGVREDGGPENLQVGLFSRNTRTWLSTPARVPISGMQSLMYRRFMTQRRESIEYRTPTPEKVSCADNVISARSEVTLMVGLVSDSDARTGFGLTRAKICIHEGCCRSCRCPLPPSFLIDRKLRRTVVSWVFLNIQEGSSFEGSSIRAREAQSPSQYLSISLSLLSKRQKRQRSGEEQEEEEEEKKRRKKKKKKRMKKKKKKSERRRRRVEETYLAFVRSALALVSSSKILLSV